MAKRYSKSKGKSGSKRPIVDAAPPWVEMSADEVVQQVVEMGKKGVSPAMIGQILRDNGVPSVRNITGKKIMTILREHGIKFEVPPDLLDLIKKEVRMRKHLEESPHSTRDIHNKERHKKVLSSIQRLVKYYKKKGVLPEKWKYTPSLGNVLVG